MTAFLRHFLTLLRGRVPCQMSLCGRPVRCYGYCSKHLYRYQYGGAA